MLALRGKSDIGDKINTQIIAPLVQANDRLARSDFPDFNDSNKLGEGQAKVERLTNLVNIFASPQLDFSQNRADHDDILGDAYEYLMRHFATESGKSKGQFYTPAEVSRVIARVVGISPDNTKASTTAYDPTCGSGSLLLKVAAQAGKHITLEGQEKDVTTAGLARMNMILHDFPTANIVSGNTLAAPNFKDGEQLRTYDYVVANPPFSDKTWTTGLTPSRDPFQRFAWGDPPAKQGHYAYLLHIIRSMKGAGKAACILPHGVLFRDNAEATIRRQLVRSGYLKGIIGLPANLFYGTGIPACIVVLDKENAAGRKGVLMIDASKGFRKDGPKNRLREQDIHRIVDIFTKQADVPRYARMVPLAEIADPKNDFNLNLSRYIVSTEPEDLQDIDGHPKALIETIAEDLLTAFRQAPLLDAYDIYQHLMDYWAETMQDDAYLIAADDWVKGAQPREIVQVKDKNNKLTWPEPHDYLKGKRRFKSDLVPAPILVARYFVAERDAIEALDNQHAALEQQTEAKAKRKAAQEDLDKKIDARYPKLSEDEIKTLVVDDKWLANLATAVQGELDRVPQTLTGRIRQLSERYAAPLPQLVDEVAALTAKVNGHLGKMGINA